MHNFPPRWRAWGSLTLLFLTTRSCLFCDSEGAERGGIYYYNTTTRETVDEPPTPIEAGRAAGGPYVVRFAFFLMGSVTWLRQSANQVIHKPPPPPSHQPSARPYRGMLLEHQRCVSIFVSLLRICLLRSWLFCRMRLLDFLHTGRHTTVSGIAAYQFFLPTLLFYLFSIFQAPSTICISTSTRKRDRRRGYAPVKRPQSNCQADRLRCVAVILLRLSFFEVFHFICVFFRSAYRRGGKLATVSVIQSQHDNPLSSPTHVCSHPRRPRWFDRLLRKCDHG